jgi:hypothetical protein
MYDRGGSGVIPNQNGIFVLISHGLNKFGGFDASRTVQNDPSSASAQEKGNSCTGNTAETTCTTTGTDARFNDSFAISSSASGYDDILLFKTKGQLVRDIGLADIMCNADEGENSGDCAGYVWDNTQVGTEVCSYLNGSFCKRMCGKYGVWGSSTNVGGECGGERAPPVTCPITTGDDYGDQTYEGSNGPFAVDHVATLTPRSGFCGSPTITCLETGSWSTPVTNSATGCCTLSLYETLGSNVRSNANQTVNVGNAVAVSCFTNYIGTPAATCTAGGTPGTINVTSGCVPTCIVSSSVNLNASVKSANYIQGVAVGSPVAVVCKGGYNGTPTATCTAGGTPGTVTVNTNCAANQCSQNFDSYGYVNTVTTLGRSLSGVQIDCKPGRSTDSYPNGTYSIVSCSTDLDPVFSTPSHCRPNCGGYVDNSAYYGISGMFDGTQYREGGVQWMRSSIRFSHLQFAPGAMTNGTSKTICRYAYENCSIFGCFHRSQVIYSCYNGNISVSSEVRASLSCPSSGVSEVGSFYGYWADGSGQWFNNATGATMY